MTLRILDTDHVSLFLGGHPKVAAELGKPGLNWAITVVTVQEIFNGWIGEINQPNLSQNPVKLYTKLWTSTEFFKSATILNFDAVAYDRYQQLLQDQPELDKKRLVKDMRIAAIALTTGAIIATRNQRDFSLVANLTLEDWVSA
jgi:tRNA(fMet)-specific endonuclease VapC